MTNLQTILGAAGMAMTSLLLVFAALEPVTAVAAPHYQLAAVHSAGAHA